MLVTNCQCSSPAGLHPPRLTPKSRADYSTAQSKRASNLYQGLTEIVNLRLGGAILSPGAAELNLETVVALILLLNYEPVQHIMFYTRGESSRFATFFSSS